MLLTSREREHFIGSFAEILVSSKLTTHRHLDYCGQGIGHTDNRN